MNNSVVPEGFQLFPLDNSFTDAMNPLAYKLTDEGIVFAFCVTQKHSNIQGACHGGALMTLMDFALSGSICHTLKDFSGAPTISIAFDFMAKTPLGGWVFAYPETVKLTNSIGFAQGLIKNAAGDILVRANGSFKLPKKAASQAA